MLRLAFFGTPEFAVPTLERLRAGPHELVIVVSQPDRRRGRGRLSSPSPVSACAGRHGLALLRPEKVGDAEAVEALGRARPDLGVVVAFGQFLPKRVRELPALGYCINGHASLLPRHRGAAPIARAILAGDERTGVSVMRVEREMDAGPVALVSQTPIGPEESAGELEARLAGISADAIARAVDRIAAGELVWRDQDPSGVTLAPKLESHERHIDWSQGCAAVANRVRALAPSPGATTELAGEPLRILAARAAPGAVDTDPGRVRRDADGGLRVACGDGWLTLLRVQRAGGRAMDVAAFLRGHAVSDGARLGASS